jgi:hypothetical protein
MVGAGRFVLAQGQPIRGPKVGVAAARELDFCMTRGIMMAVDLDLP